MAGKQRAWWFLLVPIAPVLAISIVWLARWWDGVLVALFSHEDPYYPIAWTFSTVFVVGAIMLAVVLQDAAEEKQQP